VPKRACGLWLLVWRATASLPSSVGERSREHPFAPNLAQGVELVADLGAKRLRLREADVVGIRGGPAADDARLGGDVAQVLLVANPSGFAQHQHALVDSTSKCRDGGGTERASV
jgi:hypothetical protein